MNYGGAAQIAEELEFSITFDITTGGMIFNVTIELDDFPEALSLLEGESQQIKTDFDSEIFTSTWIISSNIEGNFTFNIKSTVLVGYIRRHPAYVAVYEYRHTGSFSVSEDSLEAPYLTDQLPEETISPPPNWKNITGQILGFLSIILVYLCIQLGIPERKVKIRKKFGWSAKRCREIHCDLGYLATAAIVLHNIILSQTALWGLYFKWFQFYPTFYVFRDGWNALSAGLDLAVFGTLIFFIATITGVFFKQIARKAGYRTAIFSQQISYLALIFSVLHALFNGSWTIDFPIILIVQIAMVIEVLISRVVAYNNAYNLKRSKILSKMALVNSPEQKIIEVSQDNINTTPNREHQDSSPDNRS